MKAFEDAEAITDDHSGDSGEWKERMLNMIVYMLKFRTRIGQITRVVENSRLHVEEIIHREKKKIIVGATIHDKRYHIAEIREKADQRVWHLKLTEKDWLGQNITCEDATALLNGGSCPFWVTVVLGQVDQPADSQLREVFQVAEERLNELRENEYLVHAAFAFGSMHSG